MYMHVCEKLNNKTNKSTNVPFWNTFPLTLTKSSPHSEGSQGTNMDSPSWYLYVTALQSQTLWLWGIHNDFYNLGSSLQKSYLHEDEREDSEKEPASCRPRLGCLVLATVLLLTLFSSLSISWIRLSRSCIQRREKVFTFKVVIVGKILSHQGSNPCGQTGLRSQQVFRLS